MPNILLHIRITKTPPNQPLRVKHGILRVLRRLVLGRVSDESFVLGPGDPGGGDTVALVVGDDFYFTGSLHTVEDKKNEDKGRGVSGMLKEGEGNA